MYARFFRWASDRLAADGVLAFVTNRSFVDSRTFDGFRKTVAQEFSEAYIVDLGGDVRANPKLSGSKHNVFGIQTGVAVSFFVKRHGAAGKAKKDKAACRVFYVRRPEMETAEEKLAFIGSARASALAFEEVRPDGRGNWLNVSTNDFSDLMPLASAEEKAGKTSRSNRAVARLYSLGVSTNRDDWLLASAPDELRPKMEFFVHHFSSRLGRDEVDQVIKWSETLLRRSRSRVTERFSEDRIVESLYRPFVKLAYYQSEVFVDRPGLANQLFPRNQQSSQAICFMAGDRQPFSVVAAAAIPNLNMFSADAIQYVTLHSTEADGTRADNITDWALKQFQQHYQPGRAIKPSPQPSPAGRGSKTITKEAIFHYVYAVLHDPVYREKYALNLKREFPRIPLYGGDDAAFWQWAGWGAELMALHLGYETVSPLALTRRDFEDAKARAAGLSPKPMLKSEPEAGRIVIDSETVLEGIPAAAWDYRLGNRSALDWVLDQHKEKKPKDPTIRERFNTYRLADHKERVIDLLGRVAKVSVETVRIVDEMMGALR
jgi:predicted helicase